MTIQPADDDRPLAILVLWGLAGVSGLVALWGLVLYVGETGRTPEAFAAQARGITMFVACLANGVFLWIASVVVDLLWKIERNTRGRR